MPEQKHTLVTIVARLEVIEAKLNEVLKKFGFEDETLWDIHRHVYEMIIDHAKHPPKTPDPASDESELF